MSPDGAVHLIETVSSGPSPVENTSETLCAMFLVAMIVLIGAEAIARNVFGTSLQVTDEVGGYLLVALTFLSMSVAEAHGAFHRVELIQSKLSPSGPDHLSDRVRPDVVDRVRPDHVAADAAGAQFLAR